MSYALGCRHCEREDAQLGALPVAAIAGGAVSLIKGLFGGGKKKDDGKAGRLQANQYLYAAAQGGNPAALAALGYKGMVLPANPSLDTPYCGPSATVPPHRRGAVLCDGWWGQNEGEERADAAQKYNSLKVAMPALAASAAPSAGTVGASAFPVLPLAAAGVLVAVLLMRKR